MRRGELCVFIAALLFISMFSFRGEGQDEEGLVFWSVEFNSNVRNNYHVCSIMMTIYNPHNETVEEELHLNIPNEAMLTEMTIEKEDRTYVSRVERKEKAKEEYDAAVQTNKTASLVEFLSAEGSFSISLGLDPGSIIRLELKYGEVITKYLGQYDLCIPFNIVGNYDDFRKVALNTSIETMEDLQEVNVSGSTISARESYRSARSVYFYYAAGDTRPGDMFYLKYSQKPLPENGIMDFHSDERTGYFMHVFCPQIEQIGEYIAKDIIFVIDRSGSMSGYKIETVKSSFSNMVAQIEEGDGFNIVHFNERTEVYSTRMVDATAVEKDKASRFISALSADGSTDLNEAVLDALDLFDEKSYRVPIVVFLTDGRPTAGVGNPLDIRYNIRSNNDVGAVIHTLGYGDDHDADLLKAIAIENEGEYRYIVDTADADRLLQGHYSSISHPLLRDLVFRYSEGTSDVFQDDLSILFEGSEAVILGRYDLNMAEITANIAGEDANGEVHFDDTFPVQAAGGKEFIGRLWAHRMVSHLLDRILVEGETEELVDQVASLGMNYSFVTPYTSFILVLQEEEGEEAPDNESIPEGKEYDHSSEPDYYDSHPYGTFGGAPQFDSGGYGSNSDPYPNDPGRNSAGWSNMDADGYPDSQQYSYSHPPMPPEEEKDSRYIPGYFFIGLGFSVFILAAGLSAFFIIRRRSRFVVQIEE
ncbi:MAG: VWA domain-containing protein [Thermoplasmatota archaeon]